MYTVTQHIHEKNFKSRGFSFVHDALYLDIHPDELFRVTSDTFEAMNDYPQTHYGLPVKADIVMGISMGQELDLEKWEIVDIDNEGYLYLSGYEDEFDLLIENWKSVYRVVEYEDIDEPK